MSKQMFQDPETGLVFSLMTKSPYPCRKFYFSMDTWTCDDQWLLYHEDRPGATALHKVRQTDGLDVLLADNAPFFGTDRKRDAGYYFLDDQLWELDLADGEAKSVARLPEGLRPQGHYTVSKSGLVVNTYQQRCGIYALVVTDPATGSSQTCYRSDTRLGHCQFCPGDDDTIFYVHETGGDALQRMWLFTLSQGVTRPFFVEQEGDWITHETWDSSGEELSFTHWPHSLKAGKKNGQAFRTVALGEFHHAAPSTDRSLYTADRTSKGQILLIDPATGGERVLLTHQQALTGEDHCHPSFNRAGTCIAFSAPGGGVCQLGLVELGQLRDL